MKQGLIGIEKEYYKYDNDGNDIVITEEEYKRLKKEYDSEKRDPFTEPQNFGVTYYKLIRLSYSSAQGIASVLSYDRTLNEFALEHGYHPASGYQKCQLHKNNVEYRNVQIALLGEEPISIVPTISKRCKRCRQ